jgi:peptidoglycan/LPS O-acetylase OafA/YrhL
MGGNTVANALEKAAGRPSGFEYTRIILAALILYIHSFTQGTDHDSQLWYNLGGGPLAVIGYLFVPMFFALSGFLVAGSLYRTRLLSTFLGLRALRIFPALWTDVLLAALVLGPLVTTLPLDQYLFDREFRLYLLNLLGEPHYFLPGVFQDTPGKDVNGQLWTVRWELFSYIALAFCAAFALHKNRRLFLLVVLASHVAFPAGVYLGLYHKGPYYAMTVVTCFLTGVYLYICREAVPLRLSWCAAALAAIIGLQFVDRAFLLAAPFAIAYLAVYLGCLNPKRLWIVSSGDYSYGIFLYHRQVQQLLWLITPFARSWYGSFTLSLVFSFAVSYISWHVIEKRALNLKRYLYAREGSLTSAPQTDPKNS